jgi:hypothetical protein
MQTRQLLHLALAVAAIAGCSPDEAVTGPETPSPPSDLHARAFELTIDVATGRVSVGSPPAVAQASTAPGGLSLSLLGSDIVELHASDCTFTSIPKNTKQKRCSLELAVANRLRFADLVTPTSSFPKPPQGVDGLLVYPLTYAGLSTSGGVPATPNALWDEAPANFYNDFAGACSTTITSDCSRWERYPAPLAAGETSAPRTVGFDVDKTAQKVSAYILVAADVRDAAPRSMALTPVAAGCGTARGTMLGTSSTGPLLVDYGPGGGSDGVCTFELPAFLQEKSVVSATLTVHQVSMEQIMVDAQGSVVVGSVSFEVPMSTNVFDFITMLKPNLGTVTNTAEPGPRRVDVLDAVLLDLAEGRTRSQYRLTFNGPGFAGLTEFAGLTGADTDPSLVVTYRDR